MGKKAELNYNQKLSYKSEWWRYFGEYRYFVDLAFRSIVGGEITSISLPLAFMIRHTLELGYKMNLIELEKISGITASINYSGKAAHELSTLHFEFKKQMDVVFEKYKGDEDVIDQFKKLNSKLISLKKLLHKLDAQSYSFRYSVENDGATPNFDKQDMNDASDVINFKEVKELYDDSIILLTYIRDVVNDIINKHENGVESSE